VKVHSTQARHVLSSAARAFAFSSVRAKP
jgi:hypothetical protein